MPSPSGISSDLSVNPQINGVAVASGGTQTTATCIVRLSSAAWTAQLKAVCTAGTGTWKIEVSDDLVDLNDVTTTAAPALTNPSALTGTSLNFASVAPTSPVAGFQYVRITFTCSAGSAVITASVKCVNPGAR